MTIPWQHSNANEHLYYKVVVNGTSYCFSDKEDALTFAEPLNVNVFEVHDLLIVSANENNLRKGYLKARSNNYNPKYRVEGDKDVILKAVSDAFDDLSIKELVISL